MEVNLERNTRTGFARSLFLEEHEAVRASFRRFLEREIAPHYLSWERAGIIPREVFEHLGGLGYLCMPVSAAYGGQDVNDFRFNAVLIEECMAMGLMSFCTSISLINDVALPYFLEYSTEEQCQRWMPGMVSGKLITAIAMTEASGGSDLAALKTTAHRDGDHYIVNGSKTYITNGINADLVVTAVKTDPANRHGGISLLVLERGMPGFSRGRNLEKLGSHGQDTAELFFDSVKVPVSNLLGTENNGFRHMMHNLPQERLAIALSAVSAARTGLEQTLAYTKERKAFGRTIATFQYSRIVLAELITEVEIAQIFVDRCIEAHVRGELTAEQAAMAKWWCTDLQGRVLDRCVQLHGGYGYMAESAIGRAWADARITRIYGGSNEVMKEIIAKAQGLSG
jgi:alkylation response protein AidB-like acyl-CoA dehydrogenase